MHARCVLTCLWEARSALFIDDGAFVWIWSAYLRKLGYFSYVILVQYFSFGAHCHHGPFALAGLEFCFIGPVLHFHTKALIALTGARFGSAALDGQPLGRWWQSIQVSLSWRWLFNWLGYIFHFFQL